MSISVHDVIAKHFRFKYRGNTVRETLPVVTMLRRGRRRSEVAGAAGLADIMAELGFQNGVEIGTHRGNSATIWCRVNPNLHLICVDPYLPYDAMPHETSQEEAYQEACKVLEPFNATIWRMPSMEAIEQFEDESLDFVFIDGDHRFDPAMVDLISWAPKVRKDGLVILHDYTPFQGAGVVTAIDAYTHCHRIDPWYITMDYTPTAFWVRGSEKVP